MFKIFILSILMASFSPLASAAATQLSCDDGVSDGGYRFIVQDFTSESPTVSIYTKSRQATLLYAEQQLTQVESEGEFNVFFNRLGIRTKMWLSSDRHAKFRFIQRDRGLIEVPAEGSLVCFEEESNN